MAAVRFAGCDSGSACRRSPTRPRWSPSRARRGVRVGRLLPLGPPAAGTAWSRRTTPGCCSARIAQETERMRLGTMVTPLSRRRPQVVAKHLTTLDHLSGGRATLGVGLGDPPDLDFSDFGDEASYRVRAAITDEALDGARRAAGRGAGLPPRRALRRRGVRAAAPGAASAHPDLGGRPGAPHPPAGSAPSAGTATSRSPTTSCPPTTWRRTSERTRATTGTSSRSGHPASPRTSSPPPAPPGWSGRSGRTRRAGSTSCRPSASITARVKDPSTSGSARPLIARN